MFPGSVLYHAESPPTVPEDLYDYIFDEGKLGDWFWATCLVDGVSHRCLYMLIPDLIGHGQGDLRNRGLELLCVYPSHANNNWAQPGPINGWDGNETEPTLSPSIFVGGGTKNPGWHGFFQNGKLKNA